MKNQKRQAGFTLIELMIVIAIIGILMAYAIPAYRDYTVKSNRGECNAMVDGIKTPIAEYYYKNNSYAANLGALGYSAMAGKHITVTLAGNEATCTADATAGGGTIVWTATLAGSVFNWACADSVGGVIDICPAP